MFNVRVETNGLNAAAATSANYVARLFALALGEPGPQPDRPTVLLSYGQAPDGGFADSGQEAGLVRVWIPAGDFFHSQFLRSPELPVPAETIRKAISAEGFDDLCENHGPNCLRLGFDLVAFSIWFLGRHEEYLVQERDAHGRFPATASRAPKDLYLQPVVSLVWWHLRRRILACLGRPDPFHPMRENVPVAVSHDVDLMRKYRSPWVSAKRTLGAASRIGAMESLREFREALAVLFSGKRDPYDSFPELFSTKERMDIRGTWFFQTGGSTHHDCDYEITHRDVRAVISEAKAWGDEIAIHPSYQSHSLETLRQEIAALTKVSGEAPVGARMHYLRLNVPETWRALAAAGITYDATAAFADLNGFRCGWSGPFRPFDLRTLEEIPIIAIPLCAMDITLAVYERVSPEHSLETLSALLDAAHVPSGCFSFLWHNTMHDQAHYGPFWGTFEYFLYAGGSSMSFRRLADFAGAYLEREQAAYAAAGRGL